MFGSSNNSSSPTCNFVQATNKMKTIVAKPRPSVRKEDRLKRNIILKNHHEGGTRDENMRDDSTIQVLGYGVDDHIEGSFYEKIINPF